MPNHIHGIIAIESSTGELQFAPTRSSAPTESTKIIKSLNYKIWQRNYWEHIIRNENEYNRIVHYIINNPRKWGSDKLHCGDRNSTMESSADYNFEPWMI